MADEPIEDGQAECQKCGEWYRVTVPLYGPHVCKSKARADCEECGGTGMRDTGGVYPWGEHIAAPCDCGDDANG